MLCARFAWSITTRRRSRAEAAVELGGLAAVDPRDQGHPASAGPREARRSGRTAATSLDPAAIAPKARPQNVPACALRPPQSRDTGLGGLSRGGAALRRSSRGNRQSLLPLVRLERDPGRTRPYAIRPRGCLRSVTAARLRLRRAAAHCRLA